MCSKLTSKDIFIFYHIKIIYLQQYCLGIAMSQNKAGRKKQALLARTQVSYSITIPLSNADPGREVPDDIFLYRD